MCEIAFFTCKESEPISTKNVIHDTKKKLNAGGRKFFEI